MKMFNANGTELSPARARAADRADATAKGVIDGENPTDRRPRSTPPPLSVAPAATDGPLVHPHFLVYAQTRKRKIREETYQKQNQPQNETNRKTQNQTKRDKRDAASPANGKHLARRKTQNANERDTPAGTTPPRLGRWNNSGWGLDIMWCLGTPVQKMDTRAPLPLKFTQAIREKSDERAKNPGK